MAACKIAGLNVLRLVNDTTAAAITYELETKYTEERNVIFVDFGGGKLDVALMTLEEGVLEVKAVHGNTQLGGEDIDDLLTNYIAQEYLKREISPQ